MTKDRSTSPAIWLFLLAIGVCTAFALFTDHRWEDYYITYRSSKNLAEGHGLVYQTGERVHTFTSPLGVLLPALALTLTGGRSDEAALWLFRIWCACALGGASVLLWHAAGAWGWSSFVRGFLAVLPLVESKCVDFAINGMETAFMLLWLAWMLRILALGRQGSPLQLGLVWAGLMWTRPDGFIFGGALAIGWFVFLPSRTFAEGRRELAWMYLRAAPVAATAYLPWLLWAWGYYGTFVPNTIVAKGLGALYPHWRDWGHILLRQSVLFSWQGRLREIYLPSYSWFGGWPAPLVWWMQLAAGLAAIYWAVPGVNRVGRAASLAFFLSSLYASVAPKFPWYYPCHAVAAMVVLGAAAEDLRIWIGRHANWTWPARMPFILHVALSIGILGMAAWQLHTQQAIIERQRTGIGLWLRAHRATPNDTVFLEPLGYIGFYSQLRMLDFPGLAAPPVIAARREVGSDWGALIQHLKPDWLVLRRFEALDLFHREPNLLDDYQFANGFDASAQLRQIAWLPGRTYLEYDATFDVFHRITRSDIVLPRPPPTHN